MSTRKLNPNEKLVIASHNKGKIRDFGILLKDSNISVIGAGELNLPEPEETEPTFEGNAKIKALAAAKASGLPALADDSGFCIDALNGDPGVYSARWAGPNRDFNYGMKRINDAFEKTGSKDTTAKFVTVFCLAWPDGECRFVRGEAVGDFSYPPRGKGGFGYDSIFIPKGHDKTFAELSEEYKNTINQRHIAFEKFKEECVSGGNENNLDNFWM